MARLPHRSTLPASQGADRAHPPQHHADRKHHADVRLRFYDVEFYSARVTDIWLWEAREHHAYQLLVEDLRETAFWDRYFAIVETLPGVENAYAKNYDREAITG